MLVERDLGKSGIGEKRAGALQRGLEDMQQVLRWGCGQAPEGAPWEGLCWGLGS